MQAASNIETVSVKMYPDGRMDTRNASLYLGLEEKTLAMKRSEGTGPSFIKRLMRTKRFHFPPTSNGRRCKSGALISYAVR